MGQLEAGRRVRIDESRRMVLDVLHFSASVPIFPVEKWMFLGAVSRARTDAPVRISWPVLFAKAYAQVAQEFPALRRVYLRWPRPHFYESASSVATIAINRTYRGTDRLFWGRLAQPETKSLVELQRSLQQYQTEAVEQVFRRQLSFSRYPTWFRRPIWWLRLNLAPQHRARRFGSFGLSTLAGQGVYNSRHPHLLTSSLSYGPLETDGTMLVTLLCDHRVLDGVTAARALNQLEDRLTGQIATELAALAKLPRFANDRDAA